MDLKNKKCFPSKYDQIKEEIDNMETEELLEYIKDGRDDRFFAVAELIRRKVDLQIIFDITKVTVFFLEKIK